MSKGKAIIFAVLSIIVTFVLSFLLVMGYVDNPTTLTAALFPLDGYKIIEFSKFYLVMSLLWFIISALFLRKEKHFVGAHFMWVFTTFIVLVIAHFAVVVPLGMVTDDMGVIIEYIIALVIGAIVYYRSLVNPKNIIVKPSILAIVYVVLLVGLMINSVMNM